MDFTINKKLVYFSSYVDDLNEEVTEFVDDDDLINFYEKNIKGLSFDEFFNNLQDYYDDLLDFLYDKYEFLLDKQIDEKLKELEETKNDEYYSNDYYHKQGIF